MTEHRKDPEIAFAAWHRVRRRRLARLRRQLNRPAQLGRDRLVAAAHAMFR